MIFSHPYRKHRLDVSLHAYTSRAAHREASSVASTQWAALGLGHNDSIGLDAGDMSMSTFMMSGLEEGSVGAASRLTMDLDLLTAEVGRKMRCFHLG